MAGGAATRTTVSAAAAGLALVVAIGLARLLAALSGGDPVAVARPLTESVGRSAVPVGSSTESSPPLWARVQLGPTWPRAAVAPVDPGCRTVDHGAAAARLRTQIVERAYCDLLGRAPDPDGAAYWSDQLALGLAPAELVVQLASSGEYRAARPHRRDPGWTPFAALVALDPNPGIAGPGRPTPPVDVDALTAAAFATWVGERVPAAAAITPALIHAEIVADGQRINVVYAHRSATAPPRVSPGDRGRAAVGAWAAEIGADAAINGNWYAPWDGPAVAGGRIYGGSDHGYTALFGFTADGEVIVEHHREINDGVDPRIVEGISGHPTLMHRGERTTDFGGDPTFLNRHPRTAIGLDASGDVLILVTVDGRRRDARGMTGDETARLLEQLGASEAVMLDGGGSTTMWIAGRGVVNRPSDGSPRAVGNQLAVFGS